MSKKIDITEAGPIEGTFSIDLSPGPGAYEFRGARGTGKTTCISSIDWLAGHKVDLTLHDGAVNSGRVEGFGVVAPIGGRTRRKGEIEVDTIDAEKFSLGDILDPQGKTEEVRDATRIKALASLSGAKADPKLYYALAGGQAAYEALGIAETDDPVTLATRVKSAFDKLAREKQNTADAEASHAAQLEHVPEGLDIGAESNLEVLGSNRDEARDEFQRLSSARKSGIEKEKDIAKAKESLKAAKSSYSGPTVEAAEQSRQVAVENGQTAKARVEELERELARARDAIEIRKAEYLTANQVLEAAKTHETACEQLESLASQTVSYPEEAHIAKIGEAVKEWTAAYEQGIRIRDVQQNLAKAKSHRDAAKAATKAAEEARNKAAAVFDVLATSLKTTHIQIKSVDGNPRLFVQHARRGRTAFDKVNGLSDGERVDFTLRELLPKIKSPGLLPIPQRVWQDLQPSDRKALHELAADKGLYIFGAQVDDGDLRVVYLGNGDE